MSEQYLILNMILSVTGIGICFLMWLVVYFQANADPQLGKWIRSMFLALGAVGVGFILTRMHILWPVLMNPVLIHMGALMQYAGALFIGLAESRYIIFRVAPTRIRMKLQAAVDIYFALLLILLVISRFTGIFYTFDRDLTYRRAKYFWVFCFFLLYLLLFDLVVTVIYRKRQSRFQTRVILIVIILSFAGILTQLLFQKIFAGYFASVVAFIVLFYMLLIDEMERDSRIKSENTEMRLAIMVSQIQPHFLYNTLDSIYYLCGKDPAAAQRTISEFSDYLRANLDFLSLNKLIPFSRELRHVERYMNLEQTIAGDTIRCVFDCREQDFLLPAMTIQPLVENAVHHGLEEKLDGGTVTICTRRDGDEIVITVEDDGVGFDTGRIYSDGKEHIGIRNVRERLALLCGGTLDIASTPGKGTVATIVLPIREE